MTNVVDLVRWATRHYPPLLKDAGISALVELTGSVGADGRMVEVRLVRSSGYVHMDVLALNLGCLTRFSPARVAGAPAAVHVRLPIRFGVVDGSELERRQRMESPTGADGR